MGQGRLQAARKVFPPSSTERIDRFSNTQTSDRGLWLADGPGAGAAGTGSHWLFLSILAGACSASLKLIRIGQEGVQRVLHQVLVDADAVVASASLIERHDAGWFSPMLEIAGMRHERADERLFIS